MSFFSFCPISRGVEEGYDTLAEVALDDDLSIFDGPADTAFGFEGLAEDFKVGFSADKPVDNRDSLTPSPTAFHSDMKFLLCGCEGLGFGRRLVETEVGISGINDIH